MNGWFGDIFLSRGLRFVYRPLIRIAARQILQGRQLNPDQPEDGRWLRRDVGAYVEAVWDRVGALLPKAHLDQLPTYGNRHNVFLAVVTTAAYQELLDRGVERRYAATLTGDVGWKIYSWMLTVSALPFRMTTRDPPKRIERVLRALMVFPFSAPGAPGYEVQAWSEGDRFFTQWTHCPPQAFVRRLVEEDGCANGELDAFYLSWCLYDWAAADIVAGDGTTGGHYTRPHAMSKGDPVCDMCWWGGAAMGNDRRTPAKNGA